MNYIILAAGQSSRMGTDKMFIKVGGSTLIDRTLESITSEDDDHNIGLIVSDKVNRKWKTELARLVGEFGIKVIVNKYDNTKTTNSATMCCAVGAMDLSKSSSTVVIDSDIYLSSLDLRNLIESVDPSNSRFVTYATTKTLPYSMYEYSISKEGLVIPGDYTGRHILSFYCINSEFLRSLVATAASPEHNMSEPYFDNYILESLGWRTPYIELSEETREFDNVEDVIKSGKLSVEELLELLEKTHAERDSKGMSNTTYSNDHLFIKIFKSSTSEIVNRKKEVEFHNLFYQSDRAPKLIYSCRDYSASERD